MRRQATQMLSDMNIKTVNYKFITIMTFSPHSLVPFLITIVPFTNIQPILFNTFFLALSTAGDMRISFSMSSVISNSSRSSG